MLTAEGDVCGVVQIPNSEFRILKEVEGFHGVRRLEAQPHGSAF
jgi:hypothetical protein